ncbi:zinc-binding dehydrogenase [Elizabethkingia argenteiflava]|uniref:zinc-binding dehydrogenase n=1 Tax=Elizabethkingia argenteiflava TaxID=2681556 RepID=UPI001FCF154B|nr:alcohol dehydrogenase catalytic domain-containing protein [Elizabethkingia argenteiflava]
MTKTTICGSDLGILKGKNPEVSYGTILGHEGVGEIVEVGAAVSDFKVGDKVIISCMTSCGSCKYCKKQIYAHCTEGGWLLGRLINGTQAQYVRIPHAQNSLIKLPNTIDDETAVLLSDILPTGFEIGVLSGRIKHGDDIAIVGSGPVGLAVLLTAQFYSPNRIILIGGSNDNRLKFAQSIGATHVINSSKEENVVEKIKEITDGEGVDVAIEAVGIPQTLQLCTDVIKPGGHVANIGVHGQPVELALERLWIKNITITMGLVNTNTIPDLIKAI